MDDRKLEILLATIRTGSFSKAAEACHCTQSAVTQIMNHLEDELGCKVLLRNHSGVALTPVGEALLPFFVRADESLRELSRQAEAIARGQHLPIRVGAFSSIANTWLPNVISEYQKQHPEVSFEIKVGTDAVADWMLRGEVDLILGDEDRCRAFRWFPLMDDPYFAVVPKALAAEGKSSITQEELATFPLIMAPMNILDKHLRLLSNKQIRVVCDDDSTLLGMVSQGLGVTAMPELSLQSIPDNVIVLPLVPKPIRHLGIGVGNSLSAVTNEFINYLRSVHLPVSLLRT
ncbi:MAG: LysR family transcriptional regulator [Oscillibacter sp.]|nr:LysR family transcriptional regulator [Oscillibacter sp.]